jgi:hypothetical protein
MRRLPAALPLALVFLASIVARALGCLEPSQDLRLVYAGGLTLAVGAVDFLGRRRGVHIARWVGVSFALYSAFIVLVPVLGLYQVTRLTNRVEHFGAFAVFGAGVLAAADAFTERLASRRASAAERALYLGAAWMLGWANEVIEYAIAPRAAFFDRDTLLDLTMNTLALVAVGFAWAHRSPADHGPVEPLARLRSRP